MREINAVSSREEKAPHVLRPRWPRTLGHPRAWEHPIETDPVFNRARSRASMLVVLVPALFALASLAFYSFVMQGPAAFEREMPNPAPNAQLESTSSVSPSHADLQEPAPRPNAS